MAKQNDAGLYFVDKAGRVVDENSPDVAQQFTEEDLKLHKLGPYADAKTQKQRDEYAAKQAKEMAEADADRVVTSGKAVAASSNKAKSSAPEDKSRPVNLTGADTREDK